MSLRDFPCSAPVDDLNLKQDMMRKESVTYFLVSFFQYPSEYNLMSDFDLMFKNARHYNEEGSQVYTDAITLEKALKARWRIINQAAGTPKASKT